MLRLLNKVIPKQYLAVKSRTVMKNGSNTLTVHGRYPSVRDMEKAMDKMQDELGIDHYEYQIGFHPWVKVVYRGHRPEVLQLPHKTAEVFTNLLHSLPKEDFIPRYVSHVILDRDQVTSDIEQFSETDVIVAEMAYEEFKDNQEAFLADNPTFNPAGATKLYPQNFQD